MLHHCFTQPTKWTKKTNGLADMWASRSKPKKALHLHPTAGILLQSLVFFLQHRQDRLRSPTPLPARLSLHPSTPHVILHQLQPHAAPEPVITLLLLSICDSTSASSHLRVVPVRGLAVIHRLAVFGAAWSTNESHRKRTVCGEPDSWDPRGPWSHARKVPPY